MAGIIQFDAGKGVPQSVGPANRLPVDVLPEENDLYKLMFRLIDEMQALREVQCKATGFLFKDVSSGFTPG